MTYQDWRNFGYTSRLSEFLVNGGGGGKQIDTANNLTQQQLGIASEQSKREAANYGEMKTLMQPLINKQTALASGDKQAALEAAMPVISQLTKGFGAAKTNVMNTTTPGAGRDWALTRLSMDKDSGIAGAQAGMVEKAPEMLSGIGQALGGFSLQELGAALSGMQGAGTTNQQALQAEVEKRKAWLNFFGQLAGAGGSLGGAAILKCWIAEAVYGASDPRTHLVRAYLNGPFDRGAGHWVMEIYGLIGRPLARIVKRSRIARVVLQPLFDLALARAVQFSLNPQYI